MTDLAPVEVRGTWQVTVRGRLIVAPSERACLAYASAYLVEPPPAPAPVEARPDPIALARSFLTKKG